MICTLDLFSGGVQITDLYPRFYGSGGYRSIGAFWYPKPPKGSPNAFKGLPKPSQSAAKGVEAAPKASQKTFKGLHRTLILFLRPSCDLRASFLSKASPKAPQRSPRGPKTSQTTPQRSYRPLMSFLSFSCDLFVLFSGLLLLRCPSMFFLSAET